jgi:hypothetical protein
MSRRSRRALAKVNRNTPGAVSRDVPQPVSPPSASGFGQAYGGAPGDIPPITTGGGADWLGPQNPIRPVAPPEVRGRLYDFPVGYNLSITPRQYEPIGFPELRALSESSDIVRLVIETRKDQMAKLPWSIGPVTEEDGTSATSDKDPAIKEIAQFFKRPDGTHKWSTWLRMLLEDLFVVDAPTLYCDRTRGNKLLALKQIDGATIKRIIDDWGETPKPPVPAYQEVLKGFPAINYTTDDIIYAPRNPRAHKIYGYGPVEQIIITVNIALRRQLFQLDYYAEGTMPEALIGTPKEWTPQQISAFQTNWDNMLAGNLAARRRAKFIPGDVGKNAIILKEPELTGQMDEWLARVVCFCFSISAEPFVSKMNRATAETAHDAAIEEGLQPLQQWVKELVDDIIWKFWKRDDIEFLWEDDRQVDQQVQAVVLTDYVKYGIKTINEARDVLGDKPVEGGDIARVMTAQGFQLIEANDEAPDQAAEAHANAMKPKPAPVIVSPGAPPPAQGAPPEAKPEAKTPKEGKETKGAPAAKIADAPFRKSKGRAYWPTWAEVQARSHVAPHGGGT